MFNVKITRKIVFNPHFWIIIFIMLVITTLYYSNILFYQYSRSWPWLRAIELFEFNYDIIGIFFYIPFIYSALIFWWRGALLTWLISLVIIIPRILYYLPDTVSLVTNLLYLFTPLVIVFIISFELKWREKERHSLIEREKERQSFISQIFKAQEDERMRIARELHDGPNQTLLVIATRAQSLSTSETFSDSPQSKEQIQWIKDTAISISDEMRRLSLDLRPSVLDNLGLMSALRWLINNLNQEGIKAHMVLKGEARKLSSEVDINIFRIMQEALNNVRRHSNATEVYVNIEFKVNNIMIEIRDNGKGFSSPTTTELVAMGKLGLLGMQQRIYSLNGSFNLESEIGKGTNLTMEIKA